MNTRSGLSLIEIVIALMIFTVVLAAVFNGFLISAEVNRSSKAFSEARVLGQNQLEALFAKQQLTFEDALYDLVVHDRYVCHGYSYSIDTASGLITYSITADPLLCVKTMEDFIIELSFDRNQANTLVRTKIVVSSSNPPIKRYETLYAQTFK